MIDTVVICGEDDCCSVVFSTLVGVFVFSVMWSELLMTFPISCPLWSSVYECHKVECEFTSPVRTECFEDQNTSNVPVTLRAHTGHGYFVLGLVFGCAYP